MTSTRTATKKGKGPRGRPKGRGKLTSMNSSSIDSKGRSDDDIERAEMSSERALLQNINGADDNQSPASLIADMRSGRITTETYMAIRDSATFTLSADPHLRSGSRQPAAAVPTLQSGSIPDTGVAASALADPTPLHKYLFPNAPQLSERIEGHIYAHVSRIGNQAHRIFSKWGGAKTKGSGKHW